MRRIKSVLLLSVVIFVLHSCKKCDDCNSFQNQTEPACIIALENALEMYKAYSDKRVGIIQVSEMKNGNPGFQPTRYLEMEFDKLKEYLNYIECESDKANTEISMIRFYLATYPETEQFISGDTVKFPSHNTIFMTPTTLVNGEHLGYFTRGKGEKNRVPVYFKDFLGDMGGIRGLRREKSDWNKITQASFFSLTVQDTLEDRSLVGNDMNVVPPPKGNTEMDPNEENPASVKPKNDNPTQQQGKEIKQEVIDQQ